VLEGDVLTIKKLWHKNLTQNLGGCEYGGDKGIMAYGQLGASRDNGSNLISNTGVVGTDVTGVGTARRGLAGCSYGGDKGIFGYGEKAGVGEINVSMTNLVSNTGVVATDTTGVGTIRQNIMACEYGQDKAIFGFGVPGFSGSNLVSNLGVVGTDVAVVGTARSAGGGCSYN